MYLSLDLPTTAPGWPRVCQGPDGSCQRVDAAPISPAAPTTGGSTGKEPTTALGELVKCAIVRFEAVQGYMATVCDLDYLISFFSWAKKIYLTVIACLIKD